jgi:ubiquinone biosynthesis protein
MLTPDHTPTRLLDPSHDRPPVPIAEPRPPSRFRSLQVLVRFLALFVVVLGLFVRRQLTIEAYAQRLRHTFEEIGGLWIKVGQLLSLRIDVFPAALCRELSGMQERSVGFDGTIARDIVERDLGAPVELYFDDFEATPFAAVPMGQVHRARLRQEGIWVAVKVQQPYSAELFRRDLVLIRWFARMFRFLRFYLHMRWEEGLAELEQMMREDLDFHYEAAAMRRMRRTLNRHGVYVPRVFSRYSTPHVLVSEFIHAVLMSDYIAVQASDPGRLQSWLVENNIQPRRVARRLLGSLLRQLLEDNLYHGDMRPGNIVLLRNSRLALIDFRTINFTEREYLQKYRLFLRALATRDYAKAADLAFMLCAILPVIDIEIVKEKVIRALRAWATRTLVKELPYDERSIDNATAEVVRVLFRYKCTMEWAWLRIHRSMAMLDRSLSHLHPHLTHTKETLRYFRRANRRSLEGLVGPEMVGRALGSVRTAMDIQERINEYTMFQGSLIRRHAQVFQGATNKFADTFAALVGTLAIATVIPGVILILILLEQRQPGLMDRLLGEQLAGLVARVPRVEARVAGLLLLADAYFVTIFVRLKQRLRQKDVRAHERVAPV